MTEPRFTVDGDRGLERHLARVCQEVVTGARGVVGGGQLEGVVLGGGYGRGEGGVLKSPDGDRPYNDLEFYVFVHGHAVLAQRRWHTALHDLGERLSPEAGLEVEFKVMTRSKLRRSEPSMFYYDLIMGHRRLWGDEDLLAGCDHHRDARRIPLHEATRLLMNRCSGLLFSAERLVREPFTGDDADFVGRNLAKAQLAFGDVVLTAEGQYDWSCRVRAERLARMPADASRAWLDAVRRHHQEGVEFKLHPVRSAAPREILAARHAELLDLGRSIWLWLEARRLGQPFGSPRDYALSRIDKCPETAVWKNPLLQWRHFGLAGFCDVGYALRYPRQRLLHGLCWLLWEKDALKEPLIQTRIRRELQARSPEFASWVDAYQRLWKRFN